jgi:hypothetical protein
MNNLIQKIKDLVAIYKAYLEIKKLLEDMTPELKEDVKNLAKDVDDIIAKIQATPNTFDDSVIPYLVKLSDWLKKISA